MLPNPHVQLHAAAYCGMLRLHMLARYTLVCTSYTRGLRGFAPAVADQKRATRKLQNAVCAACPQRPLDLAIQLMCTCKAC